VAFGLSLSRDRLYGQDLSDLEYLAAIVSDTRGGAAPRAVPAPVLHAHPTAQPPAIREPKPLEEPTSPGGDA
jgi:hypothetical protein